MIKGKGGEGGTRKSPCTQASHDGCGIATRVHLREPRVLRERELRPAVAVSSSTLVFDAFVALLPRAARGADTSGSASVSSTDSSALRLADRRPPRAGATGTSTTSSSTAVLARDLRDFFAGAAFSSSGDDSMTSVTAGTSGSAPSVVASTSRASKSFLRPLVLSPRSVSSTFNSATFILPKSGRGSCCSDSTAAATSSTTGISTTDSSRISIDSLIRDSFRLETRSADMTFGPLSADGAGNSAAVRRCCRTAFLPTVDSPSFVSSSLSSLTSIELTSSFGISSTAVVLGSGTSSSIVGTLLSWTPFLIAARAGVLTAPFLTSLFNRAPFRISWRRGVCIFFFVALRLTPFWIAARVGVLTVPFLSTLVSATPSWMSRRSGVCSFFLRLAPLFCGVPVASSSSTSSKMFLSVISSSDSLSATSLSTCSNTSKLVSSASAASSTCSPVSASSNMLSVVASSSSYSS
eukprot:m.206084 g.206084  ORF g.206084 m.206084 type:complete len:465 (-) comp25339_c0_seq1:993-2387(-)